MVSVMANMLGYLAVDLILMLNPVNKGLPCKSNTLLRDRSSCMPVSPLLMTIPLGYDAGGDLGEYCNLSAVLPVSAVFSHDNCMGVAKVQPKNITVRRTFKQLN